MCAGVSVGVGVVAGAGVDGNGEQGQCRVCGLCAGHGSFSHMHALHAAAGIGCLSQALFDAKRYSIVQLGGNT